MTKDSQYTPPKVWKWVSKNGGEFAQVNRPTAGATHEKNLPVGKHSLQLYSLATPNGVKVTVMLEELLALGIKEAEYDAYPIRIRNGEQFSSGFVQVNPNSKIPALLDYSTNEPTRIFESGAILLYLSEKFNALIPKNLEKRAECYSWLFWQMGSAPYLGGGFGHFYKYAPEKFQYPIDRFTMEVKRQLDVLEQHLKDNRYICAEDYSIADIAIWPWYGALAMNRLYDAAEFLNAKSYVNVLRWAHEIDLRKAVQRGRKVNRLGGKLNEQLHERHDAIDFDLNTQDKISS